MTARDPFTSDPRHRRLDQLLVRFADAAVSGDVDGARRAFADAQALMPSLAEAKRNAFAWVESEQRLVQLLPATVADLTDAAAMQALGRLRGKAGPA